MDAPKGDDVPSFDVSCFVLRVFRVVDDDDGDDDDVDDIFVFVFRIGLAPPPPPTTTTTTKDVDNNGTVHIKNKPRFLAPSLKPW